MAITLIGLQGIHLELETATTLCAGSHGLTTSTGYILRKTSLSGGAHEDVAQFAGAASYGAAVEAKRELLAETGYGKSGHYAVVDTLYACGCRGMG